MTPDITLTREKACPFDRAADTLIDDMFPDSKRSDQYLAQRAVRLAMRMRYFGIWRELDPGEAALLLEEKILEPVRALEVIATFDARQAKTAMDHVADRFVEQMWVTAEAAKRVQERYYADVAR